MIRLILIGCMIFFSCAALAQDRWLHLSGVSWHGQSGYNNFNSGIGMEIRQDSRWALAGGIYYNSFKQPSIYALEKYHWIDGSSWKINVNMGAVTGYPAAAIMPVIMPEACYQWMCFMFVPQFGSGTTAAAAAYLRIPFGN